jgi:hypothetical protein
VPHVRWQVPFPRPNSFTQPAKFARPIFFPTLEANERLENKAASRQWRGTTKKDDKYEGASGDVYENTGQATISPPEIALFCMQFDGFSTVLRPN